MKFRVIILCILLIFIGVYGWHFYYDTIVSYKNIENYEQEIKTLQLDLQNLKEDVTNYTVEYKAPRSDGLFDFCNAIVEDGYPITKCVGKKIIGDTLSNVTSCTDLNELHNFKYVDILQLVFEVEDINNFLDYVQQENFWIDRVTVYPADKTVLLDIVVVGGESEW